MAQRSTVYRADLTVSDLDRGVYAQHALTLARHPSETEERLMVRLLAFALHADAALAFGRGLSAEDEADLWQRDPTGVIERWIDVGLPDEKDIRKACGRAPYASTTTSRAPRRTVVDRQCRRPGAAGEPARVHAHRGGDGRAADACRPVDDADVHGPGRARVARERRGDDRTEAGLQDRARRLTPAAVRRRARPAARRDAAGECLE
jgi:YaeQ protein